MDERQIQETCKRKVYKDKPAILEKLNEMNEERFFDEIAEMIIKISEEREREEENMATLIDQKEDGDVGYEWEDLTWTMGE